MKIKKILGIGLLILLLLIYYLFTQTDNNTTEKHKTQKYNPIKSKLTKKETVNSDDTIKITPLSNNKIQKSQKSQKKTVTYKPSFKLDRIHAWSMLKIKPLATPEGVYYTFSGFDVIDNSTVCIVGKFNGVNLLKITKDNDVIDITLPAPPMDVKSYKNRIYVLTTKGISVIKDNKVINNITINDPKLAYFDKFLIFDKQLFLLMADGSAYKLANNLFVKQKAVTTKSNQEIWIQKTSRNSFALKATPCDKICVEATYPSEIGTISLADSNKDNIYVCLDKYSNTQPIKIKRVITNSQSQFKKELLTLPADTYTYVKNDYKIVNNKIYYVKVNEKGFRIVQKGL